MYPAYLRGIETDVHSEPESRGTEYPAYLRGIETTYSVIQISGDRVYPAYLRGIETRQGRVGHHLGLSIQPT